MDDSSSVDTAELLRSILQHKQPSVSIENISTVDIASKEESQQSHQKKNHKCEKMSHNLDERYLEVHKPSSSLTMSSMNTPSEILDCDDGESVETSELVRRIRQPLECDPTLADQSTNIPSICNNESLATRGNRVPVETITTFSNFVKINIAEVPCRHQYQEKVPANKSVPEHYDDEFILPDDSDSSDDEHADLDVGKHETVTHHVEMAYRSMSQEQQCNTDPTDLDTAGKRKNYPVEYSSEVVPVFTESRLVLPNSGGSQTSKRKDTHAEVAAISMSGQQRLEGRLLVKPIDIAARPLNNRSYGSPNSCDHLVEHQYAYHRNRNALANDVDASDRKINRRSTIERPNSSGNEFASHQKRTRGTMNEENIENFSSDDEYVQACGFGEVAKVLLDQRQRSNRFGLFASRGNSTAVQQKCDTTSHDRFIPGCHLYKNTTHNMKSNTSESCNNDKLMDDQKYQPANRNFSPDLATNNIRPRRIRDPTSRSSSFPQRGPSLLTSAKQFRVSANHATSTNTIPALVAGSAAATTWERNDVFGGSGVGAGSYQIRRQSHAENQTMMEDNFPSELDSSNQDEGVLPKKKRAVFKSKSFKKAKVDDESRDKGKKPYRSGSRSGGRRGKWGWKNKGKQAKKDKGSTTTGRQRGQDRGTNTWAGNTDDPQLRHVGGAEMSF